LATIEMNDWKMRFAQRLTLVNVTLILMLWGLNAQTETTTIKIGFMYSAAPSYTEPV
ncbi:hypothetical protein HK102_011366, partial [Quaeritorhiza haematococci]